MSEPIWSDPIDVTNLPTELLPRGYTEIDEKIIPEDYPFEGKFCEFCGCQITTSNFCYGHIRFGWACKNCRDLGIYDPKEISREMSLLTDWG